jgi:hypothetical protein
MRYHAPSIPAIECSPQVPDNTPVLICPSCGDTMQHLRTIPRLGARLEQFIFVCPSCELVEIKEVKRGGVRQPQLAPVYWINHA